MPNPCRHPTLRHRQNADTDAVRRAFAEGYALGYRTGEEVGTGRERLRQTAEWRELIATAPTADGDVSLAELNRRRDTLPEDTTCNCPPCKLRRSVVARQGGDYRGAVSRREVA